MRLGVFSDSHGNVDYLQTAASLALHQWSVDVLIHLGDNYRDANVLSKYGKRVIAVPGVFSDLYESPYCDNRIIEDFDSWKVLITHTSLKHPNDLPNDIDPEELTREQSIDIMLYGHTHVPRLIEESGAWIINPGHLKYKDKNKYNASYAVVDLRETDAAAYVIYDVNNEILFSKEFLLRN